MVIIISLLAARTRHTIIGYRMYVTNHGFLPFLGSRFVCELLILFFFLRSKQKQHALEDFYDCIHADTNLH